MSDTPPAPPPPVASVPSSRKSMLRWGGSLVGVGNADNSQGYYDPDGEAKKKQRLLEELENLPENVSIELSKYKPVATIAGDDGDDDDGDGVFDVPVGTSCDEIRELVKCMGDEANEANKAKNEEDNTPYSFYIDVGDGEGKSNSIEFDPSLALSHYVKKYGISTEKNIKISYIPLCVYKVRSVTRCADTIKGHADAVLHCAYSPCSKFLATGSGDSTIRVYDSSNGMPKESIAALKDHVLCVSWSGDGGKVAGGDKRGNVCVWWSREKGTAVKKFHVGNGWVTNIQWEPLHLSSSSSSDRLCVSSKSGSCSVYNVNSGRCEFTLQGHLDSVEDCVWSGEGLIYTASRDRTIKVWSADSSQPNGTRQGALVKTLTGHSHRVNSIASNFGYACRTGGFEVGAERGGSVSGGKDVALKRYNKMKESLGGVEMLVSGSDDNTMYLWSPTTSKHPLKRMLGHQQAINHICYSPDGRYVASASFDKKVKLWDGMNGNFISTFTGHVGPVYRVSWSFDSRYIASASKDSTLKLWCAGAAGGKSNRAKDTLPGHEDEVYAIDWSPDGRYVASGSKDRTVKIWKH